MNNLEAFRLVASVVDTVAPPVAGVAVAAAALNMFEIVPDTIDSDIVLGLVVAVTVVVGAVVVVVDIVVYRIELDY